jgi:hypothetical protein
MFGDLIGDLIMCLGQWMEQYLIGNYGMCLGEWVEQYLIGDYVSLSVGGAVYFWCYVFRRVGGAVHVQIVSAQIVSAQFVSAQIVSAQIVSGTNCIGNKLYREHMKGLRTSNLD